MQARTMLRLEQPDRVVSVQMDKLQAMDVAQCTAAHPAENAPLGVHMHLKTTDPLYFLDLPQNCY